MKSVLIGVLAALVVGLGGYFLFFGGSADAHPQDEEQALLARVHEFWRLRLQGDWGGVYDRILDPAVREQVSRSEYVSSRGMIRYLAYKIEKVEIEGDRARVTCSVEVKLSPAIAQGLKHPYISSVFTDDWVRKDGAWYRRYEEQSFAGR